MSWDLSWSEGLCWALLTRQNILQLQTLVSPSLFQRWRRMEAVVMAEMEIRLMVGVTSTWSTLRPRGSSGALSGSEFFMAFPSWSGYIKGHRSLYWFVQNTADQKQWVVWWSYQERLGIKLQLGSVQNVLQSFPSHLPLSIVSRHQNTNLHTSPSEWCPFWVNRNV